MAVKPLSGTGSVPKDCPLGFVADGGVLKLLPIGTMFVHVPDHEDKSTWSPMVLIKSSYKRMIFRCACGQQECTRMMEYPLVASGEHPYKKGVGR
jgi:hypothetical protein